MNFKKMIYMILACVPVIGPMSIIFWFGIKGSIGKMDRQKVAIFMFPVILSAVVGGLASMALYATIGDKITFDSKIFNIDALFTALGIAIFMNPTTLLLLHYWWDRWEID